MNDLLTRSLHLLQQRQIEGYLVGGSVRDQLLGRESHDIDFVVASDALTIAKQMANQLGGAYYPLDTEREAARVILPDRSIVDVARLRGADIYADLALRDFTINAMARPLTDIMTLIDPHHGADDLRMRTLRAVSEQSFLSDPLRLMRAVRIAAELNFTIEPQTGALIQRDGQLLLAASGERVRDELVKIVELSHVHRLAEQQLLPLSLPHAQARADTYRILDRLDTVATLTRYRPADGSHEPLTALLAAFGPVLRDYLQTRLSSERTRWIMLKLAVLYDDVASFAADLQRLKFSRHEIEFGRALVRHRARFEQLTPPFDALTVHRFFRETGAAALGLIVLGISHTSGTPAPAEGLARAMELLKNYVEAHERVIAPAPLINGAEMAEQFGLSGPQIGRTLEALIEAQVSGAVQTRAEAEQYVRASPSEI